jgi:hypothetical protein
MTTHKQPEVNLTLPFEHPPQYKKMIKTGGDQLLVIKGNAGYAGKPTVVAAATTFETSLGTLGGLLDQQTKKKAELVAIEHQIPPAAFKVVVDHDALETTLNQDAAGDEAAIAGWGGKPGQRTVRPLRTDAPVDVRAYNTKVHTEVAARCKAEKDAVYYSFQMGNNADPTTWPQPVNEAGAIHKVSGLTPGQKVYFRIAIFRRKTGLGQWSDIVEVTVK